MMSAILIAIFIQLTTIIHFITYAIDFGHVCTKSCRCIYLIIFILTFFDYPIKKKIIFTICILELLFN